jgi:integrase
MKRQGNRLTPVEVRNAKKDLCDGYGLWLQVSKFDTKSWLFRFMIDGKQDSMGLGALNTTPLATARKRAQRARELLHDGINPREARDAERSQRKAEAAKAVTFRQAAERYIEAHRAGWRSARHAAQWSSTISTYCYPVIGDLSVQAIDVGLVMKVLEPMWRERNETASRLRGRIELILDYAKALKLRSGENPARWRGHLDKLLPAPGKVQVKRHHAALAYQKLPAFVKALRERDGMSARALELTVLTAARAGETIGARWSEVDLKERLWVVPPDRMKGHREHRVALSDRVIEILKALPKDGDLVFPGMRVDNLTQLVRDMGEAEATAHGFRSAFSTWVAEQTAYPSELAELALAHRVGDATERAYRRSDQMEKRRRLMADWAAYCARPPMATGDKVVAIGAGRE